MLLWMQLTHRLGKALKQKNDVAQLIFRVPVLFIDATVHSAKQFGSAEGIHVHP